MTKPERYTWHDEFKDVNVAKEFKKLQDAAAFMATVVKAAPSADKSYFSAVSSAVAAVHEIANRISGKHQYDHYEDDYTRRLAEWESMQDEVDDTEARA